MENVMQVPETNRSAVNHDCCCFNLRKVTRAVTQLFDRHLEPAGIRATQFTLLVELSSTNAKTLTQIAENLVMDRTTLTRNLRPLEKMELITTTQPIDKRSKGYVLTQKGRDILEQSMPMWEEAQRRVTENFGVDRYANILSELKGILGVIAAQK